MLLILEVISYKGLPPTVALSGRFDERGGTIGRSPDNHLSLPDEDKFISRHHAEIRYDNGDFVLRDVSTGGTWLCKEGRLLTQGSVRLMDGDHLKIGEYEIWVRIEQDENQAFADLFSGLPEPQAPVFGVGGQSASANAPPLFDDGVPPLWPSPSSAPQSPRPSFLDQAEPPPFQQNFIPPDIQQKPTQPEVEGFSIEDFLTDGFDTPVAPEPAPSPVAPVDFDVFDPFISDNLTHAAGPPPASYPPVKEAVQPALAGPSASAAAGLVDVAAPPSGLPRNAAAADAAPRPAQPFEPPQDLAPAPPVFVAPRTEVPQPTPGMAGPAAAKPTPAINMPRPGRPSSQSSVSQPVPAPPAAPTVGPEELFQCFLNGAGLVDFPRMTAVEQMRVMRTVGVVYREMVDGMMKVLRARSEEKREMRWSDMTTIQPRKNNPLKFFPTAEDTMRVMLAHKSFAYIDADEAVREGFADIMKHQMAMRAGMQAALSDLLKRFDPKIFEESFKEGIVFQKKAKCWDAYSKAYPNLVGEVLDDLFGDAFAEAYQEQMRILSEPRR